MINNQHFKSLPPNPSGVTMADRSTIRLICFLGATTHCRRVFCQFKALGVLLYSQHKNPKNNTIFYKFFTLIQKIFYT